MSKHTEGPWGIRGPAQNAPPLDRAPAYIITPPKLHGDWTPIVAFVDAKADARLIAAAPDLLAACEALVPAYDDARSQFEGHEILSQARAAIAKAKGQA